MVPSLFLGVFLFSSVFSQDGGDCKTDVDCGEKDPCCSRFGFCGEDSGYCYPIEGCILRGVEIEGGDLTAAEGGGGVEVERGQLDGCAFICEENSLCGWYTYEKSSNKCFLKGTRGYLSNGTQTAAVISGSTQSGGCVFNPREEGLPNTAAGPARRQPARRRQRKRCQYPYQRYGNRCIHYCQANQQWGINQSNNRRNYFSSKLVCNEHESNLPYSLDGADPEEEYGNDWHWLNYPPKEDQCLALRPSRYEEGAAYFPCAYKFNFACQIMTRNERKRTPKSSFPTLQIVKNISQFNFERQICNQQTQNCQGGGQWIPNYRNNNNYGGCGLNSCDRGFSGYSGVGYNPYMGNNFNNNGGNNFNNNGGSNFNTNSCNNCNGLGGYSGVINRGQSGGCNKCGGAGGGNGFNYNNYQFNGNDYNTNSDDYDYDDYDYYGAGAGGGRGGGGGRRGGGGGIINVGGGGNGGNDGSGARRQKPSKFLKRRRQEIRPVFPLNPYLKLVG